MSKFSDAKAVAELVKEYAKSSSCQLFWRDIIECAYNEERDEWRVVYEASPALLAPYYKYEVIVDAQSGAIKSSRRLE